MKRILLPVRRLFCLLEGGVDWAGCCPFPPLWGLAFWAEPLNTSLGSLLETILGSSWSIVEGAGLSLRSEDFEIVGG